MKQELPDETHPSRAAALVRFLVAPGLVIGLAALGGALLLDGAGGSAGPTSGPASPAPVAAPDPAAQPSASGSAVSAAPPATQMAPAGQLRVPTTGWATDFSRASVDLSEIISGGPGKDGIPAIDEPRFETVAATGEWLSPNVPVIALEVNGEARAYPIAILIWHEIVNDTLGGVPVVVTFCPLCNTALAFERTVDGTTLDFGTTGNLRFSDLVMYDRQTESWWQQATGEAIVGAMTGRRLRFLPAQMISLADFAARYPDAALLSRDTGHSRPYGQNPYVGYDELGQQPFLFGGVVDGRLPPMERAVTVTDGGESVAYPYSELAAAGLVEDEVGGSPIVIFWQTGTASALDASLIDEGRDVGATGVFRPIVDGRSLRFGRAGPDTPIRDLETSSSWSITGLAVDGPMRGKRLEPVVHGDHFWFAWAAFEPATRIWTATGAGE